MEKQKKKQLKKIFSWVLLAAIVILLAFMPLLAAREEALEGPQASILSGKVERSDISTRLVGGGRLKSQEAVEITVPSAVKLTKYLVSNGDSVKAGDVIAEVDRVTVMTAIAQVQETLDYIAEQIQKVSDEESPDTIVAQAGGKVKIVYAQVGDNVQDVMLEHGALAVLSLDGLMAVRLEGVSGFSVGEKLIVALSDGTEVSGKVESNLGGVLIATVDDNNYAVGEEVKLSTLEGEEIGCAELYIHSQWNALAYSGTVSSVRVKEGDSLNVGRIIMDLKDTGHSARFYMLANQHGEYEELMLSLFEMYQSKELTAPCDGTITGVDENAVHMLSNAGGAYMVSFLANAPNGSDDTEYLNYVGQVKEVGIDGLIMKMNPQGLSITDYKKLDSVPLNTEYMTEEGIYSGQAPIYELSEGAWTEIDRSSIKAGDILLFAADSSGGFVWVVRVSWSPLPDDSGDPEDPGDSGDPEDPEDPNDPDNPDGPVVPGLPNIPGWPSIPSWPNIGIPQIGGFGGGMMQQEPQFELYSLDTLTVACVNPQEKMMVDIAIDELDITKIYVGQSASVTVDALGNETYDAEVTNISNSGVNGGGNSKFTVRLVLPKSGKMLPGMNASVIIDLETVSKCLSVPVAAVGEIGTKTVLYTGYDEEDDALMNPVEVVVGASNEEMVEIVSGIGEGEVFYYSYYNAPDESKTPEVKFDFTMG